MSRVEYNAIRTELDGILTRECANCGSDSDLHIHHIVPLAVGGSNRLSNLVRLCSECHAKVHGGSNLIQLGQESARKKVSKGGARRGSTPYGYRIENGKYVIDEEQAEVVRLIFRIRYLGEYSTINIATYLNNIAIISPRKTKWAHPAIAKILNNPIYFGEAVYKGESFGYVYDPILDDDMKSAIERFNKKYEGKRVPNRYIKPLY